MRDPEPPPIVKALAVLPTEVSRDCAFFWSAAPMVMKMADERASRSAGVILGFWFAPERAPVDQMAVAVSNILSTKEDQDALIMITMEFKDEAGARNAEEMLQRKFAGGGPRIARQERRVALAGEKASASCNEEAWQKLLGKLKLPSG